MSEYTPTQNTVKHTHSRNSYRGVMCHVQCVSQETHFVVLYQSVIDKVGVLVLNPIIQHKNNKKNLLWQTGIWMRIIATFEQ